MRSVKGKSKRLEISTILLIEEQVRVDAAGEGFYTAHHRTEPRQVLDDVQNQAAVAVLVSVRHCETEDLKTVGRMVREISRVPTIALLSDEDQYTAETLLKLGQCGVHELVDIRGPSGWKRLRTLLSEQCIDDVEMKILEEIRKIGNGMTDECWTFFTTTANASKQISSVRKLARLLNVLPSTLMSRFFRAGLPAPKQYLAMVRLIRAAYLFENEGFSIANVANHLEYSSPQSFGRHIRSMMGITALSFRKKYRGDDMLELFEENLILPYRSVFSDFSPLSLSAHRPAPTIARTSED